MIGIKKHYKLRTISIPLRSFILKNYHIHKCLYKLDEHKIKIILDQPFIMIMLTHVQRKYCKKELDLQNLKYISAQKLISMR